MSNKINYHFDIGDQYFVGNTCFIIHDRRVRISSNNKKIKEYISKVLKSGDIAKFLNYYDIKKKKTIEIIKENPNLTKKELCKLAQCSHYYLLKCIKEFKSV